MERHKTLVTEGIGSKKEQLELEARLASSISALSAAERTLHAYGFTESDIQALQSHKLSGGRITLRSPVSGTIVDHSARIGLQVAPETDLFHIVDMGRLRVQLEIPEKIIELVAIGQDIGVICHESHKGELRGRIERIGGSISPDKRTITAMASIVDSARHLRPGAFVTIKIKAAADGNSLLAVPAEAVIQDEYGDLTVFMEIEPGEFKSRQVAASARIGNWIGIVSGIEAGERVVMRGAFAVKSEADKSKFGHGHAH